MRKLKVFVRNQPLLTSVAALLLFLSPVLLWQVAVWTERNALDAIRTSSGHTLTLTVANLRGELSKFEVLPRLLARDEGVLRFLQTPGEEASIAAMNRTLEELNSLYGASDTYLMNAEGLTLAASNWNQPRPFIGKNFAFRPYFQDAIAGRPARYFALGTTSRQRGYYFGHPVGPENAPLGVAVVKVGILPIEAAFAEAPERIMVTDAEGVVFIASDPAWHYRALEALPPETIERIERSQQYAGVALKPLPLQRQRETAEGIRLITITDREGDSPAGSDPVYLSQSAEMPEAGWTVHILASTEGLSGRVASAVLATGIALLALALAIAIVMLRRSSLQERFAVQQRARTELEQRVTERTAELTEANIRLEAEVADRTAAEAKLRQTQDELVQAGKLAALGKLSAGISHELNQPLAAIRSFSDNAKVLAERGRFGEVGENLGRISGLTERMARIITHLKTFARKDRSEIGPIALQPVLDDTLALLESRIAKEAVEVHYQESESDLWVRGGSVRLQQVLLNLLGNALDAMAEMPNAELPQRVIDLSIGADEESVTIAVRDRGPGIAPEVLPNIFDPFYSTKEVNEGLGLGLSISYGIVESFGGAIRAANHPDGGAVFTLTLPRSRAGDSEEPEAWQRLAG